MINDFNTFIRNKRFPNVIAKQKFPVLRTFVCAVYDVNDPRWETCLVHQLHEDHTGARVPLRGLHHHRVPRHQRHREHLQNSSTFNLRSLLSSHAVKSGNIFTKTTVKLFLRLLHWAVSILESISCRTQTSKKNFAFAFAFAQFKWTLKRFLPRAGS